MSKEITSLKLQVAKGEPSFVEITTLGPAGQDLGYDGVLAAGKAWLASFDLTFEPDGGAAQSTRVFGVGGTEPLWGGKKKAEKDLNVTDPDPGTGPNPGYSLEAPEGFNVGSAAWFYDLGYRFRLNSKHAADGNLTIQGHVDGVGSTQSVRLRVEGGKVVSVQS